MINSDILIDVYDMLLIEKDGKTIKVMTCNLEEADPAYGVDGKDGLKPFTVVAESGKPRVFKIKRTDIIEYQGTMLV